MKAASSIMLAAGLAMAVMSGPVIWTASNAFLDSAQDQNEKVLGELGKFNRFANLTNDDPLSTTSDFSADNDDSSYNAEQKLNSLTYLITARAAHCKVLGGAIRKSQINKKSSGPVDETLPNVLKPIRGIDDESIRDGTLCEGKGALVSFNFQEQTLEWAGLDGKVAGNPFSDQEGNVGNFAFVYPKTENEPLKIDPYWVGSGYHISNYAPSDGADDNDFWDGDKPLRYGPDPALARYIDEYRRDGGPGCQSYYVPGFTASMKNVALVTSEPIYTTALDDDGKRQPLIGGIGNCDISGSSPRTDYDTLRGTIIGANEKILRQNGLPHSESNLPHDDYRFVICPNSTGRIQANAGHPFNRGEAKAKKKMGKFQGYAGENVVYPFVELTDPNYNCLNKWDPKQNVDDDSEETDQFVESGWSPLKPRSEWKSDFIVDVSVPPQENTANSNCGAGMIGFREYDGGKRPAVKVEFEKSSDCDAIMKVNADGVGGSDEDVNANEFAFDRGQEISLEIRENQDGSYESTVYVGEGRRKVGGPHNAEIKLDELKFRGKSEAGTSPDYLEFDIKRAVQRVYIADGMGVDHNLLDREKLNVQNEGSSDAGYRGDVYQVRGDTGTNHIGYWDLEDFEKKLSLVPSCSKWSDLGIESITSIQGTEYKVKCGLDRLEPKDGAFYYRYSVYIKRANQQDPAEDPADSVEEAIRDGN